MTADSSLARHILSPFKLGNRIAAGKRCRWHEFHGSHQFWVECFKIHQFFEKISRNSIFLTLYMLCFISNICLFVLLVSIPSWNFASHLGLTFSNTLSIFLNIKEQKPFLKHIVFTTKWSFFGLYSSLWEKYLFNIINIIDFDTKFWKILKNLRNNLRNN